MTRDEILNMPAGRELDILVLREVMKYKPSYIQEGSLFGVAGELDCWYDEDGRFYPLGTSPSTDIAAAWEVVESWEYNWTMGRDVGQCGAEFETEGNKLYRVVYTAPGMPMAGVTADTAPLAICRAALLAVLDAGEKQAEP